MMDESKLNEIRRRLAEIRRGLDSDAQKTVEAMIQWIDALQEGRHAGLIPVRSAIVRELMDAWETYQETGFDEKLIEAMTRLDESLPPLRKTATDQ